MSIHPTAIVSPKAELGAEVTVGPMAIIEDDVTIGDHCHIGSHAVIMRYTTLGADCRVHSHAVLGDLPQDLAFDGRESYVRIGAACIIREGVTVHRGTKPGTVTEVGNRCFLMANSHLGHNVRLGDKVILANGALLGGYVEVGAGAFISGNCLVHQFVRVGRLAMLGGGCATTKDVPPFCIMPSLHLNQVTGLNIIGLRRAGMSPADRLTLKKAFKILYLSGLNFNLAAAQISKEFQSGPARELADFVTASRRGICRHGHLRDDAASGDGDEG